MIVSFPSPPFLPYVKRDPSYIEGTPSDYSSEINVSTCPRHPDTMNQKIPGNHQASAAQLHRFSLPAGLAGPLPLRSLWLSGSLIVPASIIAMLLLRAFQRGYLAQGVPMRLQNTGLYLMNDYSVFNVRRKDFLTLSPIPTERDFFARSF